MKVLAIKPADLNCKPHFPHGWKERTSPNCPLTSYTCHAYTLHAHKNTFKNVSNYDRQLRQEKSYNKFKASLGYRPYPKAKKIKQKYYFDPGYLFLTILIDCFVCLSSEFTSTLELLYCYPLVEDTKLTHSHSEALPCHHVPYLISFPGWMLRRFSYFGLSCCIIFYICRSKWRGWIVQRHIRINRPDLRTWCPSP